MSEQITELEMPTNIELIKMVQMLTIKMTRMEVEMLELKRWVNKKKRKINALQWLNTNMKNVSCTFEEWTKNLNVEQEDFIYLLENKELNISRTIQRIFENNIVEIEENDNDNEEPDTTTTTASIPLKCFTEKQNMFYIYTTTNEIPEDKCWKQMDTKEALFLLKIIQQKLMTSLINWKATNQHNIDENDALSAVFNKAVFKLVDLNLTENTLTLATIKKNLYNYIKTDFHSMIEYEF